MTTLTLANVIYTSKVFILELSLKNYEKLQIGSKYTASRQEDILTAIDIYIDILEYYYYILDNNVTTQTVLLESDINNIIELITQAISAFKDSYYA